MSLIEPSTGLFDTNVELDTIERGLRRGLGTTKRCGGEKSVTRIGENQGFFSRVGLLHCNWPSSEQNLPPKVAIKITTLLTSVAMHSRGGSRKSVEVVKKERAMWGTKAGKLKKWHNNEIFFYDAIQSVTPPTFVPRMYFGRKFDLEEDSVGFVCMEYADGCHLRHIYQNLSVDQVEKTLTSLAILQCTMQSVSEENRRKLTVNAYEELYADILQPGVLSFRLDELRYLDPSLDDIIQNVEDCAKLVSTKMARREHQDMGMAAVFVHGDLYSPNLLWKEDEEGEMQLHKIIDWQLCHFGCAAEDISRLLISSLSTEDRREKWEELLEYYHTVIRSRMEQIPFTLEQLKTSYGHFFSLAALAFLGTVPEVYRAAEQSIPASEKAARQSSMAAKVKGILEDILYFSHRKQG